MIDLHTHSIHSDGTDRPEVIARMAGTLGLKAVALTDHDTLAGLEEFLGTQPEVSTRLVPGIELSCRFLGKEFHVIGLFIDPENPRLRNNVESMRQRREDRNSRLMERLHLLGIPIEWDEVRCLAATNLVSRAHFAKALAKRGKVPNPQEAFRRILGEGCPGYVPFEDLEPREAAQWIREAGGVSVVAHPGRTAGSRFLWDGAMADLKAQGLQALEAYYGEYGPSEERYFRDLAERLRMACSGGSDYHGSYKPGMSLGTGRGNLKIPDNVFDELEALRPGNSR